MKLVGLMLARNEDWVIGLSARAALMWCDELAIILHACEDETVSIVAQLVKEFPGRVWAQERGGDTWYEMLYRQEALRIARDRGATHIALIDADEILTANALAGVRKMTERLSNGVCLQVPWLQMRQCPECLGKSPALPCCPICTYSYSQWGRDRHPAQRFSPTVMSSGMWARQNSVIAFKDNPKFHWAARNGYDFHHRQPMGLPFESVHLFDDRSAGCMHLQFLSRRRLVAKQFLYQLTERLRWSDREPIETMVARYAPTVHEADRAQVSACSDSWWEPYADLLQYLHVDREPWQEKECQRIIAEHPGIERGLEDFGLVKQWWAGSVIDSTTGAPVK